MKINFNPSIRNTIGIALAAITLNTTPLPIRAQEKPDTLELSIKVTPEGTSNDTILQRAPNPEITIKGEKKKAIIVVDLSKNILYQYDKDGNATTAYLVASGKKRYPTDPGIRVVTHIEKYPYKSAPETTRRRRKPNDYGPRIICLEKVDPQTGKLSSTGEFIHGTNNPNSLGKYASLGCIRMDNGVIKKLSEEVKRGDLILINK